ncbi:hypothetical protein [Arcanobacterium bovis]|uniref:hypothetical protein n=1 Tax=Arcanobacterium bovis TaxID=2529275 RepID=UPI0013F178E5|nr:hypothetical protein [Arcanobacterium bovis]
MRVYVVEPVQPPFEGIVSLLMHVKQDHNKRLNALQDQRMDEAMDRCFSWAERFTNDS